NAVTAVGDPSPAGRIDLAVAPNPTFGRVTASFSLPYAVRNADLAIFDATGRRVKTLLSGPLAAGPQVVTWSGRDDQDHVAPLGIFFMRLSAGPASAVKKVLMIR